MLRHSPKKGVDQSYRIEVNNEHVIVGNDGIIRCVIPSFASDFVEVVAWETDDGTVISKSRSMDRIGDHPSAILFLNSPWRLLDRC